MRLQPFAKRRECLGKPFRQKIGEANVYLGLGAKSISLQGDVAA
jgi:hypothetical protein